jgi:Protein of unknown function (DUF2523)
MPIIAGALAWLIGLVPLFVGKIIVGMGVGVVSYVGASIVLTNVVQTVMGAAGSIGGDIGAFLGLAKFDVAISMILSAYTSKFALVWVNGVISKVQFTNTNVQQQ